MILGVDFSALHSAIVNAFDEDELRLLVRTRLSKRLGVIVRTNASFDAVVRELIEWAERHGALVDLMRAAYLEKSSNSEIVAIYEKFGLAAKASVQTAGKPVQDAPLVVTSGAFERTIVDRIPAVDIAVWGENIRLMEGRVCRIERNGGALGTGFLVGADLVLTNYHVLEKIIEGEPANQIGFRFDYKVLADGSLSEGVVTRLAQDWKVDYAPYSAAEKANDPDRELPKPDELDFVLARLDRQIGDAPVVGRIGEGARPRGWVAVPAQQVELAADTPLIIAQHPSTQPMKLAIDTKSIISVNANGTRVRYRTNTDHGSSGSPCFSFDWTLVAVHHIGDPASTARYNQGVPIGRILARPKVVAALKPRG